MSVDPRIASCALVGAGAMACGSGGSTLLGSLQDASNVTIVDAGQAEVSSEVDVGADADAAIDAADADATATDDAVATMSGDESDANESGDTGDSVSEETGPFLGSMPTPPTMALVRLANWSPDSPAIDLCIAPHGTSEFQGPIVAHLAEASMSDSGADGLASPWVSAYVLVAPGKYDGRVVVAGAGSCDVGIGPDSTTLPTLAAGGAETIALMGSVAPSLGGYKMRVVGFLDDVSTAGGAAIRVINAVSGMPQIDVGTGTLAANTFLAIFQHVPIGMTGQSNGAWIPFLVDANGYDPNPPLSNAVLSAHATGATTDAVPLSNPPPRNSIGPGAVVTIAVVGEASNGEVSLVECVDNAGTLGAFGHCVVSM